MLLWNSPVLLDMLSGALYKAHGRIGIPVVDLLGILELSKKYILQLLLFHCKGRLSHMLVLLVYGYFRMLTSIWIFLYVN